MTGFQSKKAMAKAADIHAGDFGYEESTHEKQAEFEAQRNYNIPMEQFQHALNQATIEMAKQIKTLESRIAKLESYHRDDGK